MTPLLVFLTKKKKKSSNGFCTFQKAATSFLPAPPSPALPKGAICHLPPLLSPPPLKADREPRAGHSASLFHCLLPGGRQRACLLIAQISPFFPSALSLSISFSLRKARRATLTDRSQGRSHALLRAINLRGGGGSRNFLRLTRCVFRRPIPTQMMNTTSFQISHPLSAAAAVCVRQEITRKHGSTRAIISYTEPHIPSDAEPLYLDCSKKKKKTQR